MADSFEKAIALTRVSDDEHEFVLPDGWQQGRGAFGGLVLGVMLSAMMKDEPDRARLPRAFTGDLCGPALPVVTRIKTRVLRRGKNQSNHAATLTQNGEVVAHATSVMAVARKIKEAPAFDANPPAPGSFEDVRIANVAPPFGPQFALHYEYRPTSPLPFSGAKDAIVEGFVRERVLLQSMTAPALLGRLDSYWPCIFPIETAPRPIATVSFMAEILCEPSSLDPTLPLFYRARAVAQAGGYFVEYRELWNGSEPVAFNQQSFAMIG